MIMNTDTHRVTLFHRGYYTIWPISADLVENMRSPRAVTYIHEYCDVIWAYLSVPWEWDLSMIATTKGSPSTRPNDNYSQFLASLPSIWGGGEGSSTGRDLCSRNFGVGGESKRCVAKWVETLVNEEVFWEGGGGCGHIILWMRSGRRGEWL